MLVAIGASVAIRAARETQAAATATAQTTLPARLSDADFWALVSDISEPGAYFRITDNYTSNEREVGQLFTMLRTNGVRGGVYMGVGPEQNFSYIAAIKPVMAFICDIRRQAVMQHLMFKAMFELSKDRADFISILFSRPRPAGLDAATPIQKMWDAYINLPSSPALVSKNYIDVVERLTKTHKFVFTAEESGQLETVFQAFVGFGPGISTRGSGGGGGGNSGGTFADLTGWSFDASGQPQSFLSTEENFQTVKALHDKNLIVPVSGDFGGHTGFENVDAPWRVSCVA